MPHVLIPAAYRRPTQGKAEVEVAPGTVRECLERVEELHPGFLELCIDDQGRAHRFIKLFINEEPIDADTLSTLKVAEGDRLEVLAAVAGG
jgi:molybdopterin synthase sulfur carrier subunit